MKRAHCMDCGAEVNFDEKAVKISLNRRGGGAAYLCRDCKVKQLSYYHESTERTGTKNKDGDTFGVELETSFSTSKARAEIIANKYIPTHDATVDCEYKSPIMEGLNGFSKHCTTFERLIADGELEINDSCGTHFHYGNRYHLNPTTMGYIRRFYHSLFVPLSDEMQLHRRANTELFGRDFGYWANIINVDSDPMEHTNFINVQHDWTLEFRICKFRNAEQMMKAARLVKKIGHIVMLFVKDFDESPKDETRYKNITAWRLHKAAVAGQKIRRAYLKAIGE